MVGRLIAGEWLYLDVAEPNVLAFGLEGDVAVAEWNGGARLDEAFCVGVFWVELRVLETVDFFAVYEVYELLVSVDFYLEVNPLADGKKLGGGIDNVVGKELAVAFDVSARRGDVASLGACFGAFGEELSLDADGEGLVELHALGRLGVEHDAAVESGPERSVFTVAIDELVVET